MVQSNNICVICPVRFFLSEINHVKAFNNVCDRPKTWPCFHVVPIS